MHAITPEKTQPNLAPVVGVTPTEPDPAFVAARALDVASAAWSAAFQPWEAIMSALDPRGLMDWDDSATMARAAMARAGLGGAADAMVSALAAYEAQHAALEVEAEKAEALFRATRPTSELGAAAMRAAARRCAARPGERPSDEAALMGAASA